MFSCSSHSYCTSPGFWNSVFLLQWVCTCACLGSWCKLNNSFIRKTRRDSVKRRAWEMGDYGDCLILLLWVLHEYTTCRLLQERGNRPIGIVFKVFDTLSPSLEVEKRMQLTCSWLVWVYFSLQLSHKTSELRMRNDSNAKPQKLYVASALSQTPSEVKNSFRV